MGILNSGDQIADRYHIISPAGEGGMQEVYKANDNTFDRIVALKTPKNPSAKKEIQSKCDFECPRQPPKCGKNA